MNSDTKRHCKSDTHPLTQRKSVDSSSGTRVLIDNRCEAEWSKKKKKQSKNNNSGTCTNAEKYQRKKKSLVQESSTNVCHAHPTRTHTYTHCEPICSPSVLLRAWLAWGKSLLISGFYSLQVKHSGSKPLLCYPSLPQLTGTLTLVTINLGVKQGQGSSH